MTPKTPKSVWPVILLAVLLLAAAIAHAQNLTPFNQRDDKYRLLGLKRAKGAYEVARAEHERQKELHERGLINDADLERARSLYADAEVNYQQSLLAVLFEQQYVSVSQAIKYQASDGTRRVRLTLANTSGGSAEFRKLLGTEDELFRSLQPDVVHNTYVSLLNDEGAIISQPYEIKIDVIRYAEPVEVEFTLLQDLDAVTVYMIYSNGTERNMKIFLQKDVSVDRVAVQSEQFSQEIELGKSTTFDLTLELFSGTQNTYALEVVNLPRQIGRFFKSRSGKARLSQVKFTESGRTKQAELNVTLPDRPTSEVVIDEPIAFYVLVIPRDVVDNLPDLRSRTWTESEIKALNVGFARLELIPRGKGELLVRAPILFHSISAGEEVAAGIDLYNEGSHRIDNIEITVDLPLNWTREPSSLVLPSLEIAQESRVDLRFIPPADVAPGKYDLRLRTSGMSNSQPVNGEDKTFTVEIRAETNIFGSAIVVVLLLVVVGGMVIFGVRLSRR